MQMKKCLTCGNKVEKTIAFCPNCGRTEFDTIDSNITEELTPEDSPWNMQNNTVYENTSNNTGPKKKNPLKKILTAILACILILVFGTLFVNMLKDETSNTLGVAYTKGEIVGNSYFNEWADISISFPTTYSNASEDMYTSASDSTTDCCMFFEEMSGGSIMLLSEGTGLSEKNYLNNIAKSLEQDVATIYAPFETYVQILAKDETVEIAGYTYYHMAYQIAYGFEPTYFSIFENIYVRKVGNRMISIVTSTGTMEQAESIISLIMKYEENEMGTENIILDTEYDASPELSSDIDSFQVQVLDKVFQFPVNYDEFAAAGWKVYEKYNSVDEEIQSGFDSLVWFEKDGMLMNCHVFNPDVSVQTIDGCVISGIAEVDASQNKDKKLCVFIPGGFKVGEASREEVLAAFREPDSIYEGDTLSIVTFETDNVYATTKLSFDANGILCDISVENPIAPEDYVYSSADTSYVAEYTVPTSMGSKITDRIVNFDGDLYQLPVTVSALMENGWTTVDAHETVRGGSIYFIDLERNGVSFRATVYNYCDRGVEVMQSYIQELSSYDVNGKQFEISGGIHMQMTEDELKAILSNEGIEYGTDTSYDTMIYGFNFGEDTLDNYVRIGFIDGKVQYIYFGAGEEWRK